jgi:hypothetical protein
MRKSFSVVALLAASFAPAVAQAGGSTESSSIQIADVVFDGQMAYVVGNVSSAKRCEKGRTVELYFKTQNGAKILDTDTTSDRGGFNVVLRKDDGKGNPFVRVLKSNAGDKTCGADKTPLIF